MEKLIYLKKIGTDGSGFLSSIDGNRYIDFQAKSIFTIHSVPKGSARGRHAHKKLQELLWCPYGIIEVIVDNGIEARNYLLSSPEELLFLPEGLWITIIWKKESSVLCVAASNYYEEDDYIRNYNDYLEYIRKGYWNNESKI